MRYYGEVAEIAGCKEENIQFQQENTSKEALSIILKRYPAIQRLQITLALNNQLINGDRNLKDGDTIDLFPPFSGG